MKKFSGEQRRRQLTAIAGLPDEQIDTSDIAELTEEQLRRGVRSQMYRPIKKPVTMRLDADVIEWLKRDGPGYQTRANSLLRSEMIRSYATRKVMGRAGRRALVGKKRER